MIDKIHLGLMPPGADFAGYACGTMDGHWTYRQADFNCEECFKAIFEVLDFASEMCQKNCTEKHWDIMERLVDKIGLPNGHI